MAPEHETATPQPIVKSSGQTRETPTQVELPPLIKTNLAQQVFFVFLVIPAAFGLALWKVEFDGPGSTWHAYESTVCIIVAVVVWFAVVWRFLSRFPNPRWFAERSDGE